MQPRAEPMNLNEATSVFLLAIERVVLEVEETSRKKRFLEVGDFQKSTAILLNAGREMG